MDKELTSTVSIIRFILNNTSGTWNGNLEILIKTTYNKGDIFKLKDIYEKFEHILQLKYPKNNTVKNSIQRTLQNLRDKNIQAIGTRPKIAGYTKMGKSAFSEDKKPTSHEVIPDDVIEFMNERINNLPNVVDWGIIEYDATNKSEMWEYIE